MATSRAVKTPDIVGVYREIDELDPRQALDTLEKAKNAAQRTRATPRARKVADLPLKVDPAAVGRMGLRPVVLPLDGEDVWERLPGERIEWYARFELYRSMPLHERSIPRAWRKWRAEVEHKPVVGHQMSDTWRDYAAVWRWKERAEAWDEHQLQLGRASEEEARLVARTARRSRLVRVEGAVNEALEKFTEMIENGYKPRPQEMVAMLKLLHEEQRTEFDDNPAKKVKHEGEVDVAHKVYMGWDPKSLAAPQDQ